MLVAPQTEKQRNGSRHLADPAAIREQLKRLLAHPLFTNSKRYPVLLAFTVEQTLLGNAGELKERTIGVEAFGREPSYDVNLDPIVRTTAAEVRKRLIQYYYNSEHAGELVIELPVGSYIPAFREPPVQQPVSNPEDFAAPVVPAASPDSGDLAAAPAPSERLHAGLTRRHWALFAAGLAIALVAGFGMGRTLFPRQPTNLQRFWEPVTSAQGRVTYCLGRPADAVDGGMSQGMGVNGGLDVSDVVTLARSIVPLVPGHDAFRVVSASQTPFAQLRESPIVLIGAFDNIWTMRITQDLPFGFEADGPIRKLVDRKSVPSRYWTLQWQVPNTKLAKDYAIVARIHDNVTGQPVIIIAGILGEGTEAASEVVSNPAQLDAVLRKAPRNWDSLNMEAVIETNVIDGHAGPPNVIAVETW